jgi:hypothetical protein
MAAYPSSEMPYHLLFWGAVLLYVECVYGRATPRRAFLCGCLIGGAMLIRAIAAGCGPLLALGLCLDRRIGGRRRRLALAGLLLAGNLMVILPWEVTLTRGTGRPVFLGTSGRDCMVLGLTMGVSGRAYRHGFAMTTGARQVMLDIQRQRAGLNTYGDIGAAMRTEWRLHPRGVCELFLLKLVRSWYATDSETHEGPIALLQLAYIVPGLACACIVWRRFPERRSFLLFAAAMVCYAWGVNVLTSTLVRYSVTNMGFLFLVGCRVEKKGVGCRV